MSSQVRKFASVAAAIGITAVLSAAMPGVGLAQGQTYVMKISLPTLNDPSFVYAHNLAAAIEKDSGGRIKPQVFPASQLGSIPRQIEGAQFGSIQCVVIPPEFFVGVDERFELMSTPGLVDSMAHGQRLTADPELLKLMLGLGANKGLRGMAMFMNAPSSVLSKAPIRHLTDFRGKKIRVLASQFQAQPLARLGATPIAMTLGDVIPAMQQGTIDGSVGGIVVFTPMHFQDAGKYVTETGQPGVFVAVEVNKKWYESLPPNLQAIVERDARTQRTAIVPIASEIVEKQRKGWTATGGELISLPPNEQADMMKMFSAVVAQLASVKPDLADAYKIVREAAQRTR
jgi:TRAP-type C4-dicarboxylate transport system substrate-binding protein